MPGSVRRKTPYSFREICWKDQVALDCWGCLRPLRILVGRLSRALSQRHSAPSRHDVTTYQGTELPRFVTAVALARPYPPNPSACNVCAHGALNTLQNSQHHGIDGRAFMHYRDVSHETCWRRERRTGTPRASARAARERARLVQWLWFLRRRRTRGSRL